jgi:hypothetical protein
LRTEESTRLNRELEGLNKNLEETLKRLEDLNQQKNEEILSLTNEANGRINDLQAIEAKLTEKVNEL